MMHRGHITSNLSLTFECLTCKAGGCCMQSLCSPLTRSVAPLPRTVWISKPSQLMIEAEEIVWGVRGPQLLPSPATWKTSLCKSGQGPQWEKPGSES